MLQELRRALRGLVRSPGLVITATATLGLGIALTVSMFSIVRGALQDLPFEDSDRLVHLERIRLDGADTGPWIPPGDFLAWREGQTTFEGLAAFRTGPANLSSPGRPPERRHAALITADLFDLLRVEPVLGRGLLAGEDRPGAPRVVLLGDRLWRDRFGADPGILGRSLRVNGEPATVVGVLPEGFRFPLREDLWLPLVLDPVSDRLGAGRSSGQGLRVFGRLAPGVSSDRAGRELATLAARLAEKHPETNRGFGVAWKPYTEGYVPAPLRALLRTMQAAVFGVLLIACANVAHLLLVRSLELRREAAVRMALGASRIRLIRQRLVETAVLAALGGGFGLAVTMALVRVVDRLVAATEPPFWVRFEVDSAVLLFVLLMVVLVTLLAGLLPAVRFSGARAEEVLRSESDATGAGSGRLGEALVVVEVALTCGLLAASGVMVATVVNLRSLDLGFSPDAYLTGRVELFDSDYPQPGQRRRLFEELQSRVSALPGVGGVALATTLPASVAGRSSFVLEGEESAEARDLPSARLVTVTPGLFATLDLAPLEGRSFLAEDHERSLAVALVDRAFAERFAPGESPVGRRLRLQDRAAERPWRTIVGVVPSLHPGGPGTPDEPGIFLPLAQSDAHVMNLVAHASGDPLTLAAAVRRELQALDPNQPLAFVTTLRGAIRRSTWFYDLFGTLFLLFGGAALVLATVGLYGVVAYSVTRRTREVGVRMALGAKRSDVLRLVVQRGALELVAGLALGLGLALLLTRLIRSILFQVEPWDPASLTLSVTALAAAGMGACLIPAWRALTIEPATALRRE